MTQLVGHPSGEKPSDVVVRGLRQQRLDTEIADFGFGPRVASNGNGSVISYTGRRNSHAVRIDDDGRLAGIRFDGDPCRRRTFGSRHLHDLVVDAAADADHVAGADRACRFRDGAERRGDRAVVRVAAIRRDVEGDRARRRGKRERKQCRDRETHGSSGRSTNRPERP